MTKQQQQEFAAAAKRSSTVRTGPAQLPPFELYTYLQAEGKALAYASEMHISTWKAGSDTHHPDRECHVLSKVKYEWRIRETTVAAWAYEQFMCKQCAKRMVGSADIQNAVAWARLSVLTRDLSSTLALAGRANHAHSSWYTAADHASAVLKSRTQLTSSLVNFQKSTPSRALNTLCEGLVKDALGKLEEWDVEDTILASQRGMSSAAALQCAVDVRGTIPGAPYSSVFNSVPYLRSARTDVEVCKDARNTLLHHGKDLSLASICEKAFANIGSNGPLGWEQLPDQLAVPTPPDGQTVDAWMRSCWQAEFDATQAAWTQHVVNLIDDVLGRTAPPLKVTMKLDYGGNSSVSSIMELLEGFSPEKSVDKKVTSAVVPAAVAGACLRHAKHLCKGSSMKVEPICPEHKELVTTALSMFEPGTELGQLPFVFTVALDMFDIPPETLLGQVPTQYHTYPGVAHLVRTEDKEPENEVETLF